MDISAFWRWLLYFHRLLRFSKKSTPRWRLYEPVGCAVRRIFTLHYILRSVSNSSFKDSRISRKKFIKLCVFFINFTLLVNISVYSKYNTYSVKKQILDLFLFEIFSDTCRFTDSILKNSSSNILKLRRCKCVIYNKDLRMDIIFVCKWCHMLVLLL